MNFNKKLFPWFILFSSLGLISVAAYFSIIGISTLFAGAAISVGIMALFLELGKISAVTFAYRYWDKCKLYLKSYLIVAITILMIITSMGISAMLMAAYQKSSIEYAVTQDKIKITEQQITFSQQNIDTLINLRTSQNTNQMNEFVVRNPLLFKQFQQQIVDTDINIEKESKKKQSLINSVNELKLGTAEKKDVQIFKFLADTLGMSLDKVARWFIVMIVFVFDPLAVCLILAYNVAVYNKEDDKQVVLLGVKPPVKIENTPPVEIKPEPIVAVIPPALIPEPKIEKTIVLDSPPPTPATIITPVKNSSKDGVSDFFKQMFKL